MVCCYLVAYTFRKSGGKVENGRKTDGRLGQSRCLTRNQFNTWPFAQPTGAASPFDASRSRLSQSGRPSLHSEYAGLPLVSSASLPLRSLLLRTTGRRRLHRYNNSSLDQLHTVWSILWLPFC